MTISQPLLSHHPDILAWQVPRGWVALSSAAVGGGLTRPGWVLNIGVDQGFDHTDLDAYTAGVATRLGLVGPGCALLTAADVAQVEHASCEGVRAWATVGVTKPTWAVRAAAEQPGADSVCHNGRSDDACDTPGRHTHHRDHVRPPTPGTINLVVTLPVPLTTSALVQAVGTITEAKAQVLVQAGVPGTGTASDALVVLCPDPTPAGDPVPFAGVRSLSGQHIAHATHAAVSAGLSAHPWPQPDTDTQVVW